jgi:hypothetical protein
MRKVEHFVTIFDSNYLPQGITLYNSLQKHYKDSLLWIICVDYKGKKILERYNFDNIRILFLKDFENEELLELKSKRSRGEYIWTLSPFLPEWVFNQDVNIERITYLDADMYFLNDPSKIFQEFDNSNKSILITEHGYDKEYDISNIAGRFCVQLIIYNRYGSEEVLKWWKERCIEWCFAKFEDGKCGDQKYLDLWPTLFSDKVHILSNNNLILAPWNTSRYSSEELILWHFHGLRLLKNRRILLHSGYKISKIIDDQIYRSYISDLLPFVISDEILPKEFFKYNKTKKQLRFILGRLWLTLITFKIHSLKSRIKIINY